MSLALSSTEDLFTPHLTSPFWCLRAIGYPPLPATSPGISCGAHTDYGCTTFLLADETRGALEVRDKQGGWIGVDPLKGAYVVNIGDMLEVWTNGLWKSTVHRVVHRGTGFRVSVPFFLSRIGMRGEFSRMRCFSYFKRKDELIGLLEWSHCSVV